MKKAIYILLILLILALISIAFMIQIKAEAPTQLEGESKFPNPDRIVYKNEQGNYYIFEKNQDEFTEIFARISNGISMLTDVQGLEEGTINKIKDDGAFLEFDYNSISKNYIFPLDEEEIGVIKMIESNGQVQNTKINNKDKIKEYLEKITNKRTALEFMDCKNYVSKNKVTDEILAKLSGFEQKNQYYYQRKFTSIDEFSDVLEQLNFMPEEEETRLALKNKMDFERQNVIITLSRFTMKNVKQRIGGITFIYDNKPDENYRANVTVINKVANINCIYNNMDGYIENVTPQASPSPTTPEEIAMANQKAKKEIERYLLNGYRVDIGTITEVNVDSAGNGFITVECRIGLNEYVYPIKLKVNSQTENFLGMGMHLKSNYGYHMHELCDITLDTKITDIDNIQGYVKTIEYIAD